MQVNQIFTCRDNTARQYFALGSSEVAPAPQAPVAAGSHPSPGEVSQGLRETHNSGTTSEDDHSQLHFRAFKPLSVM